MENSTAPANAAVSTTGELPEQQQDQLHKEQHEQQQAQQQQEQQQQPLVSEPSPLLAAEAKATSSTPQTYNAFMQLAHLIRQSSPATGADQASTATQPAMALGSQMAQPVMAHPNAVLGQLSSSLPASTEALAAAAIGLPQIGVPEFEPSFLAPESQGQLQGVSTSCLDAIHLRALGLIPEGSYIGVVKFFNPIKGYGFITSSSFSRDVHFKASDMPPELHSCTGVELAGKRVIFQVEVLKDGKLKALQFQLATFLEPQVAPQELSMPAAVTALGGIATAGGSCSPQEKGQLQGFVTTYDAIGGTGILQAPGVADALRFDAFGLELVTGQHVSFILHWFPDGTAEARGVAPVATLPQNDELFNGGGKVNSFHELQEFGFLNAPNQAEGPGLAEGLHFQDEVMAADGKRSAAAALDPMQLLAGFPPLKQQRGDVSEALPGMTALGESLPGMTAMEALSGMAAGATQSSEIILSPPPAFAVAEASLFAGACPAAVPPQLMSSTSEPGSARIGGAVQSFNMAKGFGFISCPGIAEDIFFLRSELPGGLATGHAEQGQVVGFDLQLTPDGRYRAARISLE